MRFFEEPDSNLDNPKYPCGKCNLNIRKITKLSNVIHVIFGLILDVMELITIHMKALKHLRSHTFAKYVKKIYSHFNICQMTNIYPLKKE